MVFKKYYSKELPHSLKDTLERISLHEAGRNGGLNGEDLDRMEKAFKVREFYRESTDSSVKIYPMVHIAPSAFYESRFGELLEDFLEGRVLHFEGVRGWGKKGKKSSYLPTIHKKKPYSALARTLSISEDYLTPLFLGDSYLSRSSKNKDLAFSDLTLPTRLCLRLLTGGLELFGLLPIKPMSEEKSQSILRSLLEDSVKEKESPELFIPAKKGGYFRRRLKGDILEKRNEHAIREALKENSNRVSLIWGGKHLEGMKELLLSEGFKEV